MTGDSDIAGEEDVVALVVEFYRRALADPLLGPVFRAVGFDIRRHLPVMQDFWMTVLFRAGRYRRNALAPHRTLHLTAPLTQEHFDRWVSLWCRTVQAAHQGPVADHAQLQATRIAGSLLRRIEASEPAPGSRTLLQLDPAQPS